jgi:hypothetical protein
LNVTLTSGDIQQRREDMACGKRKLKRKMKLGRLRDYGLNYFSQKRREKARVSKNRNRPTIAWPDFASLQRRLPCHGGRQKLSTAGRFHFGGA